MPAGVLSSTPAGSLSTTRTLTMSDVPHLRIARPVTDLKRTREMYCKGLELRVLAAFAGHDGFDGVMIGNPEAPYHFEFTRCRTDPVLPRPTAEDLVVLYLPERERWTHRCDRMSAAGFREVRAFNPYWSVRGRSFEDHDGYRIVIERAVWRP
jgi:hypothetical protein